MGKLSTCGLRRMLQSFCSCEFFMCCVVNGWHWHSSQLKRIELLHTLQSQVVQLVVLVYSFWALRRQSVLSSHWRWSCVRAVCLSVCLSVIRRLWQWLQVFVTYWSSRRLVCSTCTHKHCLALSYVSTVITTCHAWPDTTSLLADRIKVDVHCTAKSTVVSAQLCPGQTVTAQRPRVDCMRRCGGSELD